MTETREIKVDGFVIVPPLSPWDMKHRDEIWGYLSKGTFGQTAGEAWTRMIGPGISPGEQAVRRQRFMDKGYRLCRATLTLHPEDGGTR